MNKIFKLINTVTKDKRLKHSEVRVFMSLISYNSFKKIFPSLKTIAKDTGIKSIPDISKKLHNLEKCGYIKIIRRKHLSNVYILNPLFEDLIPEAENPEHPQEKPEIKKDIEEAEKVILNAYITQIAFTVAEYRKETKPGDQIYKFINRILNTYSDRNVKKYQVAFMLLVYILKAGENKFKSGLPFAYFNSFFPMLYYSDFRREMFNRTKQKQTNQYKPKPQGEENYYL